MTIFETLEYGPIVANNEELGLFVTANDFCLNLWSYNPITKQAEGIDCKSFADASDLPNGIMSLSLREVTERAKQYLRESVDPEEAA